MYVSVYFYLICSVTEDFFSLDFVYILRHVIVLVLILFVVLYIVYFLLLMLVCVWTG